MMWRGLALHRIPEIFHRLEEAAALGVVLFGEILEFAQEFFLATGEVDRGFHGQFDEHVASASAAQGGHALAPEAHLAARL